MEVTGKIKTIKQVEKISDKFKRESLLLKHTINIHSLCFWNLFKTILPY